jgi:hypothetical protein
MMSQQAIVGLVLLLVGVAVKVAAAAGLLPGDVGFIGEITNLGVALIFKEQAMPSPQALAIKARKSLPPKA